jgi:4-alpha-glucanotransferase
MTALVALSEYCGILGSFLDARDVVQTTPTATHRALLAALGVDAADEATAHRTLLELQRQDADQPLPPVYVYHRHDGPLEIELADAMTGAIEWRIEMEDGGILRGRQAARVDSAAVHKGTARRNTLLISAELECGYHTLVFEPGDARCSLIVTLGTCWLPDAVNAGGQLWGITAQLYLLRSEENWGIGDFGDLKRLVVALAARGADVVGLNPLHAMFPDDPEQASPYSPASRLLLNVFNIDVTALADSLECPAARSRIRSAAFQASLTRCREARFVDYTNVVALKMGVLSELFECCDRTSRHWRDFVAFRAELGATLERGCLFLALRKHFTGAAAAGNADWHLWPEDYRSADAPGAHRFAHENSEAVTFQAWLQFVADGQLADCRTAASEMAVGLYRDLAVGANASGAETWANPAAVVDSVEVGAPPDIYNPQGQGWGLPPFNPRALRAEGYRSFIELLRANMRHAGGIRIDHVMALQQLYWVPHGCPPREGAYVRYPLEDLVGILALESQRQKCLVVGEDLGTVPEGFRERMERAQILSYRVLFFEKDANGFIVPDEYPRLALAVAGSHDLPTLRAWWQGSDLALKTRLGLFPTPLDATRAVDERSSDRRALLHLLRKSGLVESQEPNSEQFAEAAHALLAGTPSVVRMLQIDDLMGEVDPVNVPGTSDEHPNWRRRLSLSLEQLLADSRFLAATAALTTRSGTNGANRPTT